MSIDDPSQPLFRGDGQGNIETARGFGWNPIRFTDAADCAADLMRGAWF